MTTSTHNRVPTVDIAPFTAGETPESARVVDAVRSACEEIGFFLRLALVTPGAGVASDRNGEPDRSAPGGPQDKSSERGRTRRRRAILKARRSETPGVTRARRRKKPAR